jgi:hypothetical protein
LSKENLSVTYDAAPGLLVIHLRHKEYQGGGGVIEKTVKIRQITASCIAVKSLDVPPEHKKVHPARCLDTPEKGTWVTFSCFSLVTRYQ